jgi:hypothetical protein
MAGWTFVIMEFGRPIVSLPREKLAIPPKVGDIKKVEGKLRPVDHPPGQYKVTYVNRRRRRISLVHEKELP